MINPMIILIAIAIAIVPVTLLSLYLSGRVLGIYHKAYKPTNPVTITRSAI